eukprot:7950094-Pyramimonas_sp.AAC.1
MRGTNVHNASYQHCEHPGFPGARGGWFQCGSYEEGGSWRGLGGGPWGGGWGWLCESQANR